MIINNARFVISNADASKCPTDKKHEYAFIGRSNVGKSSLINMLTGRKDLAKTSSTPGKTMLINHFLINDEWYIVDLPGYGYAQRSKAERLRLEKMIKSYIANREEMTNLFVLVDSRHLPQKIDLEFMNWLGENDIPFSIVFTKADKMSSTAGKKVFELYCEVLLERWEELPPVFRTSSVDRRGRDAILDYIEEMNKLPLETECYYEKENHIMDSTTEKQYTEAEEKYPGAATDRAYDEKVDEAKVKSDVCALNNNPRNNEIDN